MKSKNEGGVTSRSRWRWIAVLAAIAIGLVFLLHERAPSSVESLSRTSPQVASGVPASPLSSAPPPHDSPSLSPLAMKGASNLTLSVVGNADEIEVCGIGKVKLHTDDPEAAAKDSEAIIKKARERWKAALLDSDDYRARAVGLLLRSGNFDIGAAKSIDEQSLGDLVQLALGARDPAVYAIASHWCRVDYTASITSACQQLSLSEWARIDPDNAAPWLLIAGEAQQKNNIAVETDAFDHIAKSKKSDSYSNSLYAFAQASFPNDLILVERWMLSFEMMGVQAALPERQLGVAARHCSLVAIKDSKVRQDCNALAELWVGKSTTMSEFSVGLSIGARVGWSKNRLRDLAQERDAMTQVMAESFEDIEPGSCQQLQRFNDHFARLAALGEIGAARDAIAHSGQSIPDLARKYASAREETKRAMEQENAQSKATAP